MNSELQLLVIKNGEARDIKTFMQDSSKENIKVLNEMRIKALDLCKKGQINLHQMQLFFPTEMLKCSIENKIEKVKDTDEKRMLKVLKSVAATTVPDGLVLKRSGLEKALVGIFSFKEVKKDIIFGPYIGVSIFDRQNAYKNGFCWDIYKNNKFHHCVDARNSSESNWMRFVNPTDSSKLQNLEAFQRGYQVYFRATKDISPHTELLVWYSLQYNHDCHQSISKIKSKPGKSLEDIVSLISHSHKFKHTHAGEKPFKCDICEKAFTENSNLTRHQLIHTGEKSFQCYVCRKAFSDILLLTTHKRTHTKENSFKCDKCIKTFTQISSLNQHKRIHTGEKPFMCDMCDKVFNKKSNLTSHKRTHTKEKSFKCKTCDKAFSHLASLNQHKRIHTGEKSFKCDICEKTFIKMSNLTHHKRIHTGEKNFRCDICDKAFSHLPILNRHKLIHTGEQPFKCDVCYRLFSDRYHLTTHKRIHTGEKPFKCETCDKSFNQRSHLNEHKRIHTGEKPFKCNICDKAFTHKSHLTSHIRIHTGEKPFQCDICKKSFGRREALNQHKSTHRVFDEARAEET